MKHIKHFIKTLLSNYQIWMDQLKLLNHIKVILNKKYNKLLMDKQV